jgi:hypothetical protein
MNLRRGGPGAADDVAMVIRAALIVSSFLFYRSAQHSPPHEIFQDLSYPELRWKGIDGDLPQAGSIFSVHVRSQALSVT